MEQITVYVKYKEKATLLVELLKSLDFIEDIQVTGVDSDDDKNPSSVSDFFDLAGIWADREIDQGTLRQRAYLKSDRSKP